MKINAVNFVCVESSYFRYVNNQQREVPEVDDAKNRIAVV